jgi:RNA polymerase sigma-70 factor, ECF subfamily
MEEPTIAEHRRFLVKLARGLGRGQIDPEDLAHDVLERWVRSAPRMSSPIANPQAWMTVVVRRLLVDRLRRQRASPEISADGTGLVAVESEATPWWNHLDADVVTRELSGLPLALRETFELFSFEGRSYRQIAGQLNIAKGTVGVRISRARALLKQRLVERWAASRMLG